MHEDSDAADLAEHEDIELLRPRAVALAQERVEARAELANHRQRHLEQLLGARSLLARGALAGSSMVSSRSAP